MTKLKEISFGANLIRCRLVEKDTAPHGEASSYLNLTKNLYYFSRNIHLNCKPCEDGRLQNSYPASRKAWNTCVLSTFADGSICLMASTTSSVENQ